MTLRPTASNGLEMELELHQMDSIPLIQVREGAETLLSMDISDDLSALGLQAGKKPEVPKGAEDLAAYYEKQLATTQLVQQRLQQQFQTLTEERLALEASLQLQTAALQSQLAIAYDKAEHALEEAQQSQRQVQEAHAAVEDIVRSVTQLAELLDSEQASQALTQSFEAVACSTQHTFQAISSAHARAQLALEFQLEVKDACQISPLLTSSSTSGQAAGRRQTSDVVRQLGDDAARLQRELDEAKKREQELEAELNAAQVLFSGLEAEVVNLQHDQAQAAAKLQVSQEELLAARSQLVAANQALLDANSPTAGLVSQGLCKLDAHLASVRDFLESLSMPQPAVDVLAGAALQEQRTAAIRHSNPHRQVSPRYAPAASRASTAGAAVGSPRLQGQVVILSAERDAARKQLGVVTARVSVLEGRCKEAEVEARRLQRMLGSVKEQLDAFAAGGANEVVAASMSERLAAVMDGLGSFSALGGRLSRSLSDSPFGRLPSPVATPPSPTTLPREIRSAGANAAPSASGTPQLFASLPRGFLEYKPQLQFAFAFQRHGSQLSTAQLPFDDRFQDPELRARWLQEENENAAWLFQELGAEQSMLADQLRSLEASRDLLEAERDQLHERTLDLSAQVASLAEERSLLLQRVSDLHARVGALEEERGVMLQQHSRQMGMAAAAGAAGAAAAVAVSTRPPSSPQTRAPVGSAFGSQTPSDYRPAEAALLALEQRAGGLEAQLVEVTAERDAAVNRTARLEEQVESIGAMLQRAADERAAALNQVERLVARQAAAEGASIGRSRTLSPSAMPASNSGQPLPAPWRSLTLQARNHRLTDSLIMAEELPQPQEPVAPFPEALRMSNPPSASLLQSSLQSFASEAPLAPTRRFTDTSEYHTYLLDPTEPLEELINPSVMLTSAGGDGGAMGASSPRGPASTAVGPCGEVTKLQDAVCNLLVSKALESAKLEVEFGAKLAAARQEHQAEIAQLRQLYDDKVAQLQVSFAATAESRQPASQSVWLVDRSTSSGGAPQQADYEEELLQHIAGLEVQIATMNEAQEDLVSEHEERRRQLDRDHLAEVASLKADHEVQVSRLQTSYEDQLMQLRHILQQHEDAEAVQRRTARDEVAALRQQLAGLEQQVAGHKARADELRSELAQQRDALLAAMADLRVSHDAHVGKLRQQHDAEVSVQLEQLRLAHEQQDVARSASEDAAREELAGLQRRIAGLEEDATKQLLSHKEHVAGLEASFESLRAQQCSCHEAKVSQLQKQLADLQSELQRQRELQAADQKALNEQAVSLQRRIADLEEEVAQLLLEKLAADKDYNPVQLEELRVRHEAEVLQLNASWEKQVSALREVLKQRQDAEAAQQQAAWNEAASLRCRIVELEESSRQLQCQHEEELAGREQLHNSQLAELQLALKQQQDTTAAKEHLAQDDLSALQNRIAELRVQHQASIDCLSSKLAEQEAAHRTVVAGHTAELDSLRAAHDQELSQLRLAIKALEAQLADRQFAIDLLASELSQQQDTHQTTLAERDAHHQVTSAELQARHDMAMAGLQRDLAGLQADICRRDATIAELQAQVQLLKSDKDLEEQSLRSLSTTKAWMTEEIRMMQAELRDTKEKLTAAEDELASWRAKALFGVDSHAPDCCCTAASPKLVSAEGAVVGSGIGSALEVGVTRGHADSAVVSRTATLSRLAAEQLAEAAMQAAVAELRLETVAGPKATNSLALGWAPNLAATPADQSDLMAETVALHCELDRLKAKCSLLQAQHDAMQTQRDTMQAELQLLQNDKDLEEQSLQSLSTTKAWMTEDIRTMQAELKVAKEKLTATEVELASWRAKALPDGDGDALNHCCAAVPPKLLSTRGVATLTYCGDAPEVSDMRKEASSAAASRTATLSRLAAEQLAEAAMLTAVADLRLETLADAGPKAPGGLTYGCLASIRDASASVAPPNQNDLMMETVVLRSELDELKVSHSLLQAQRDAMSDELQRANTRLATIAGLQAQLQLLQTDKDLQEQSLQSLLTTKAWMSDEIRTMQAELKGAKEKLTAAEAELSAWKAKELSGSGVNSLDHFATVEPPKLMYGDGPAKLPGSSTGSTPVNSAIRSQPESAAVSRSVTLSSLAAEQLAEAAMQAAVADLRLETLADAGPKAPGGLTYGCLASVRVPGACTVPANQNDLMMETVILHGELDELKAKHSLLQTQCDALGDELVNAVLGASLAEAELEHLQTFGVTSGPEVSSGGHNCSLPDPAREALLDAILPPPDHLGAKPVSPLQQTRQLQQQLKAASLCVQELIGEAGLMQSAAGLQRLSTLWPSITTALKIARNVEVGLAHQQQAQPQQEQGLGSKLLGRPRWGSGDVGLGDSDVGRARTAYHDARQAFEVLRADAEELNTWLWRWGLRLREQLNAALQELSRVQQAAVTQSPRAVEEVLSGKDAQLSSAQAEIAELQSCLQEAHARLMRRDGQVATLQDMLVQLSEQVTQFEGVVVRCEVLSAGLVSKAARV